MTWQEINPSKGILQAQGEGYSLSSTLARGFGILAFFSRDKGTPERKVQQLWAPTPTADSFAFGICPCDEGLEIPDLHISTDAKILELVFQWDHTKEKMYHKMHQKELDRQGLYGHVQYGFSVVLGVMAPFLPASQIPVFRAPHPEPRFWHQWSSTEEWWVFWHRLQDFLTKEGGNRQTYEQLHWINDQLNSRDKRESAYSESGISINSDSDFERRKHFETLHADTRKYTKKFNQRELRDPANISQERSSNFYELLKSFACLSIERRSQAEERLEENKKNGKGPTNVYGMNWWLTPILTESEFSVDPHLCNYMLTDGVSKVGHIHWDKLDELVKDMRDKGFIDPIEKPGFIGRKATLDEVVIEAWATMMFRHILFHRTSAFDSQGTIKSEYRNSKIPVYIG